jgi:hypothetical protein
MGHFYDRKQNTLRADETDAENKGIIAEKR